MNVQNLTVKLSLFLFLSRVCGGGQSFFLVPDFALYYYWDGGFFFNKLCKKLQ